MSRLIVYIICTLLIVNCGCSHNLRISNIGGYWDVIDVSLVKEYVNGNKIEEEGYIGDTKSNIRIFDDGSFDLSSIYTPYYGAKGLKYKGDKFYPENQRGMAKKRYVEVTHSIYESNLSEIIIEYRGDKIPYFVNKLLLSAILQDYNTMKLTYTTWQDEYKQTSVYKLKRIDGRDTE